MAQTGIGSTTVGEILVKLGFVSSEKSKRDIAQYTNNIDNITKKTEGAFSKIGGMFSNLDKTWKGIFKGFGSVVGLIQTFLSSTAVVGNVKARELDKSYKWLFSSIGDYAENSAKRWAKALNLSEKETKKMHKKTVEGLIANRYFGPGTEGQRRKSDYGFQLMGWARAVEAADPHEQRMEDILPKMTQFVSTKGGGEEFIKRLTKGVTDPELLAKRTEWIKMTQSRYFTEKGSEKYRMDLLREIMTTLYKRYDPDEKGTLRALDRLESSFKEIIDGIHKNLTGPIDRVVKFLDDFNKMLKMSDEELEDFISKIGSTTTVIGSVITAFAALRAAIWATNKATFGLIPLAGKGIWMLLKGILKVAIGGGIAAFSAKAVALLGGLLVAWKLISPESLKEKFPKVYEGLDWAGKKVKEIGGGVKKYAKTLLPEEYQKKLEKPVKDIVPFRPKEEGVKTVKDVVPFRPKEAEKPVKDIIIPFRPKEVVQPSLSEAKSVQKAMTHKSVDAFSGRPITITQDNRTEINIAESYDPEMLTKKLKEMFVELNAEREKLVGLNLLQHVGSGPAKNPGNTRSG